MHFVLDEHEWVCYVLNMMHDEFIWLNEPFKISNNANRVIISLCSSNDLLTLKYVKNQIVIDTTGSKFDRAMTINDILEHDVRFDSMVIGYKSYNSNKENSVSEIAIYAVYEMIWENKKYDLCELLWSQLMKNLEKIKQDKKHPFKYGTFIMC